MEAAKREIKIGDHVRGAAGSQGYYTQPGELLEAVVTDLNPDGDVRYVSSGTQNLTRRKCQNLKCRLEKSN
ncbi:MAG: hypothetical protein E6123_06595 [Clostridiales bacterium]|nr:hypothetical protein [Clostridiales bacterium]